MIAAVYIGILFFDFIPICKSKNWKLIAVYASLYLASLVILVMTELNMSLLFINQPIQYLIRDVLGLR